MLSTDPLSLYWLPAPEDFTSDMLAVRATADPARRLESLTAVAGRRLDFLQTRRVDTALSELARSARVGGPRLRLMMMGSGSLEHLAAGIRVGALRRGLLVDVETAPYGQWRQEILDTESRLYSFEPHAVLLALDHASLSPRLHLNASVSEVRSAVESAVADLSVLWRRIRERTAATVVQQLPWSDAPPLFGHGDRLVAAAPRAVAARLELCLADAAADEGVVLLDPPVAEVGNRRIADPALWHHAKQAVSPAAGPWFGDHVARVLAAVRGLSKKVLVLDLDNTIWGGTIGDDGLNGIVLGQGSATGEAFASFQRYARRLADRGVLLAACSKNDAATVEAALAEHPEMELRRGDFAAFEVSWGDKASALRRIASDLSLGIDSLVFVDDNPAERALVRRELPEVSVPELPDAPELFARCIADAGYFEAVSFTAEDAARRDQYAANRERRRLETTVTDIDGFLRELDMTLTVVPFRAVDIQRIAQLINKTNQFNLTTRRYAEAEVRALMTDPSVLTYAGRLVDRFGDNGLTSIVIARRCLQDGEVVVEIDTWLMSCRILGRRVEHAMLAVIAADAAAAGGTRLLGRYRPTPRNGLVKGLYPALGFTPIEAADGDDDLWSLPLDGAAVAIADHLKLIHERAA